MFSQLIPVPVISYIIAATMSMLISTNPSSQLVIHSVISSIPFTCIVLSIDDLDQHTPSVVYLFILTISHTLQLTLCSYLSIHLSHC